MNKLRERNDPCNPMKDYRYVYFLGIGGIGMSALARWMRHLSLQVFGYDQTATALTEQLAQEGIAIGYEDDIAAIPTEILHNKAQSLIVYTPAIPPHSPLLTYFSKQGYAVHKRAAVVGTLTQDYLTLAAAGTHGKTTTAALATHLLYQARKNIIAFVGGILKGYDTNFLVNGNPQQDTIVVIEADEFDRSFLHLHPDLAIITTVDADHLDIYGDQQGVYEGFRAFARRVPATGRVIIHQAAAQALALDGGAQTRYALEATVPIRAENVCLNQQYASFDYVSPTTTIRNLRLPMPGQHQVENALAVITACLALGLDAATIRQGINTFPGIKRHFEYIIQREDLIFVDDYAHHPTEISALLSTLRKAHPRKKITVLFQPHTYTRTRDFATGFAQSLDLADQVFLLDIYPAREEPIPGVTSALIGDQMQLEKKYYCTHDNVWQLLAQESQPELMVTVGAGDISTLVAPLRQWLLQN